jgi:hypothetical protein
VGNADDVAGFGGWGGIGGDYSRASLDPRDPAAELGDDRDAESPTDGEFREARREGEAASPDQTRRATGTGHF